MMLEEANDAERDADIYDHVWRHDHVPGNAYALQNTRNILPSNPRI